jgi:phosphatidylserine/phosphatidylglycerophosphate/cardiolipin synthase-like enzyme
MAYLAPEIQARVEELKRALAQSADRLARVPGVIAARPGFRMRDGIPTTEPAIVVTVLAKQAPGTVPPGQDIHRVLEGLPVDIEPASPAEQLAFRAAPAPLAGGPRPIALEGPAWERTEPPPAILLAGNNYQPPQNASLDEVDDPMTVLCHCSPDQGWPVLKQFLEGINRRLTLAMYDFTAPHIFETLRDRLDGIGGRLEMILDPKLAKKTGEMTEVEITGQLAAELGNDFDVVWAALGSVNGIFSSSYHAKVAVADGKRFWLSSGNWQKSNQPDADPVHIPADRGKMRKSNREWHVVVEHQGLAGMFERFIRHDRDSARPLGALPTALRDPDLLIDDVVAAESFAAEPVRVHAPLTVSRRVRVRPLLTPDNYLDGVLKLIGSARRTLFIQNQYFSIAGATQLPARFQALLDAVVERREAGVDVRMILRDKDHPDPKKKLRKMVEALQGEGFEVGRHLKLQHRCHNKGIVVDSAAVALGSHNWSPDGTIDNRDATLIFFDEEIARFYERVFLTDWSSLAKEVLPEELFMPALALEGAPTPPGKRRVLWADYYDSD